MIENEDIQMKEMPDKESLRVISDMIEKTRAERTPTFEYDLKYWGIACLLVGTLTFYVTWATGNHWWGLLWLLVFVIMSPIIILRKRQQKRVVTYLDETINTIFKVMVSMLGVVIGGYIFWGFFELQPPKMVQLILPLSMLIVFSCLAMVWGVLKEKRKLRGTSIIATLGIKILLDMIAEGPEFNERYHLAIGMIMAYNLITTGWKYRRKRLKTIEK